MNKPKSKSAKDFRKEVLSGSPKSAADFRKQVLSGSAKFLPEASKIEPAKKVSSRSKKEPPQDEEEDEPKSSKSSGRPVKMEGVKSSNVESIGYRARARELYVRFKDGAVYVYHGVPKDEFLAFANAGSKGKYLHYSIKESYDYDRIS